MTTTTRPANDHYMRLDTCIALVSRIGEELGGYEAIESLDAEFRSVTLAIPAPNAAAVRLKLAITPSGTFSGVNSCDVPIPFTFSETSSFVSVVRRFKKHLERFAALWEEMREIDENWHVVDPPLPAPKSTCYRRVALLGGAAFLHLQISPRDPRSVCMYDVISPHEERVSTVREALGAYLSSNRWSSSLSVRANLEIALGQDVFVSRSDLIISPSSSSGTTANNPASVAPECGICYSYRLSFEEDDDGGEEEKKNLDTIGQRTTTNTTPPPPEFPDFSCPHCARPFHLTCLSGWLRSLPSAKRSFQVVMGDCPYCSNEISLPRG